MTQKAEFTGYVYAVANAESEEAHPLQTRISFVLTDFQPNSNRQAIPRSEADRVIATARGMPVKINFNGISEGGHSRATPIGPITDARLETIEDREVIMADAILWRNEYQEIDDYLKSSTAENKRVGTSWELYYKTSEELDGVEWLHDVVMAGTAIVKDPAYGDRTPILAVAENMEDKVRLLEMQNEELRLMIEGLRLDIEALKMEHEEITSAYSSVKTERDALVQEKLLEKERQEAEARFNGRKEALSEVGVEVVEDDEDLIRFIETAADDAFALFISTHKTVRSLDNETVASKAEAQIKVPSTIGSSKPKPDAIIEALSKYFERGK
jgi:hypothetical protein